MMKHLKVALTGVTWLVVGCGQGVVSGSEASISTGESTPSSTSTVPSTGATSTVTTATASPGSSTTQVGSEDESDEVTDPSDESGIDEAVSEESDEEDESGDDETSGESETDAGDVGGTDDPSTDTAVSGVDDTSMNQTSTAGGDPTSDSVGPDPLNAVAVCTSNEFWTRGEGTTMRPGEACVACHTAEREGPRYAIAGTLYPTGHEPADCNGSADSGAKIVVTDANGEEHELTPNQVGNFYLSGSIATPYTAKVVTASGEREMFSPQTNGDCNSCHTDTGASGAPGRVVPPF